MRAVNLLPRDETKRSKTNVPVLVGVVGAVVVCALLSMLFLSASSKVRDKQGELDALNAQLAVIPPPPPPDTAGAGLASQEQARLTALSGALSKRVAWDRVLRNLSLVLPNDVWLSTLNATSPVPANVAAPPAVVPGAPPTGLTITGFTYSQAGVARLLSRLEVLPDLTNVQLQNSAQAKVGTQNVIQFQIAADVRAGATAS
jgi:Tfp pilus assembly protein PilN